MSTLDCPSIAAEDGALEYAGAFSGTWADARAATGGSYNKDGSANDASYWLACSDNNVGFYFAYSIARGKLGFNLSGLPAGATITGLVLHVKGYTKSGNGSLVLLGGTHGASITTADWNAHGSTEYQDSRPTFASLNDAGWNDLTLNSAAVAAAQAAYDASQSFQICARTSYDVDNSAPGSGVRGGLTIRYTEYTGTGDDPYLTVTYTASASYTRTPSDNLAFTDDAAKSAAQTFTRTGADTVALSDAAAKKTPRSGSDTLAFSDAGTRGVTRQLIVRVYPAYDAQQFNSGGSSFSTIRNAATGSSVDDSSNTNYAAYAQDNGSTFTVSREAFLFSLAALPASWVVQAAVLKLYVSAVVSSAGGSIGGTSSTFSNPTTTSEFDNIGSTEYLTRKTFASLAGGAFTSLDFNAAGISALQAALGGSFQLATRSSFDIDNSAPSGQSYAKFRTLEWSGTDSDPYLEVTVLAISEPGGDTLTLNDGAGYDRGTAHGRPGYDTLTLTDTAGGYRRSRTPVIVTDTGAGTLLSGAQSVYSGTITVADTTGFPAAGEFRLCEYRASGGTTIYPQVVIRYTGKTSTTFTGCTVIRAVLLGGSSTFADYSKVGQEPNGESHFPQITRLDNTSTPRLLVTYTQHAMHSGLEGRIMGKISDDGGQTWGEQFVVQSGARGTAEWGIFGHFMLRRANGELWCFWYENALDQIRCDSWWSKSTDNGVTWSTPSLIPSPFSTDYTFVGTGLYENASGHIFVMIGGIDSKPFTGTTHYTKLLKTTDNGATWTTVATVATTSQTGGFANGESSLEVLNTGRWLCMMRVEQTPTLSRWLAYSDDQGVTWTGHARAISGIANTCNVRQIPEGWVLSQGRDLAHGGQTITYLSPDGITWDTFGTNGLYRLEPTDATYTEYNGADFKNIYAAYDRPNVVNAYSQEKVDQTGAKVLFQWYSVPGLALLSDTIALSDAGVRSAQTFTRTGGDTLTLTDAATWSRPPSNRTGADTVTLTDAATRTSTRGRTGGDTLTLTDTLAGAAGRSRTGADTLTLSDAASQTSVHALDRTGADTLTLSDSPSWSRPPFPRTAADIWLWQDQVSRPVTPSPPEDPGYRLTFDIGPYL